MAIVEIQLNRLGINSLELSAESVEVSPGTNLHIRVVNYGAPTHATLRTEGASYTPFTYENLYVESESEIRVPILETANPGSFDMQVISGYGMRRTGFTINVIHAETKKSEDAVEDSSESEKAPDKSAKKPRAEKSFCRVNPSLIIINLIAPVLGLLVLLLWILVPTGVNNIVMAVILYAIMLAGIIITWRSVQ
ncbi:MAG: hypothetical protein Q4Q53_06330 [Methanocorpusculum sp.]|nr:hypothetical protein [Methanocorpusculum sp.]